MSLKPHGLLDLNANSLVTRQTADTNYVTLDGNRFFVCESTARASSGAWSTACAAGYENGNPIEVAPHPAGPPYTFHVAGRFFFFTDNGGAAYDNGVSDVPMGSNIPSFLNVGSTLKAVSIGDLAAGIDAGNQIFWDASLAYWAMLSDNTTPIMELSGVGGTGLLNLYDASANSRVVLAGGGGSIALKDTSGNDNVVLDGADGTGVFAVAGAPVVAIGDPDGIVVDPSVGGGNAGLTVFSTVGSPNTVFRVDPASLPPVVSVRSGADFFADGEDFETLRVRAANNQIEARALALASAIVTLASDTATISTATVVVAAQSGTEDVLSTIAAAFGSFAAGSVLTLRADTGDTITVNAAGNIGATVPVVLSGSLNLTLQLVGSTWEVTGGTAASRETRAMLAANHTSGSTTPSLLAGLTFPLLSGLTYLLEANIRAQVSLATVGTRWLVAFSAGFTFVTTQIDGVEGNTIGPPGDTYVTNALSSVDVTTTTTFTVPPKATANTMANYRVVTIIRPSANGTLEIRGGVETATGAPTATFGAGSTAKLTILG